MDKWEEDSEDEWLTFNTRAEAITECLRAARADRVEAIHVCLGEPRCFFYGHGICPFCATIRTDDKRPIEEILKIIDGGH